MPLTNISVAEEALCLPPVERANLAKLLIDSLDSQSEADEEIRAELIQRLERLKSGMDAGLSFQETFSKPAIVAIVDAASEKGASEKTAVRATQCFPPDPRSGACCA
jgi:putative addiction module component (TIGR02574 family)